MPERGNEIHPFLAAVTAGRAVNVASPSTYADAPDESGNPERNL